MVIEMAEIHVFPLQACKNVVRQAPSLPQIKAATLLPYHLDLYGKISGMLALRRRRRRRRLRRRRRCWQQRATRRDASSSVHRLRVWKGVVVISTMFEQRRPVWRHCQLQQRDVRSKISVQFSKVFMKFYALT